MLILANSDGLGSTREAVELSRIRLRAQTFRALNHSINCDSETSPAATAATATIAESMISRKTVGIRRCQCRGVGRWIAINIQLQRPRHGGFDRVLIANSIKTTVPGWLHLVNCINKVLPDPAPFTHLVQPELLGEHFQDLPILIHDALGKQHLPLEIRVVGRNTQRAVWRFREPLG